MLQTIVEGRVWKYITLIIIVIVIIVIIIITIMIIMLMIMIEKKTEILYNIKVLTKIIQQIIKHKKQET